MVAPRGEGQIQIGIKVPARTVRQIDELVKNGEYNSRSLFVKEAIDRLLNAGRWQVESRAAIEEELRRGGYDDILEDRIRVILGRVVSQEIQ